jgi:hypothetical protein
MVKLPNGVAKGFFALSGTIFDFDGSFVRHWPCFANERRSILARFFSVLHVLTTPPDKVENQKQLHNCTKMLFISLYTAGGI